MPPKSLTFRLVPGVTPSTGRAIGFLEGDAQLDAGETFDSLSEKARQTLMSRMDWWVAGNDLPSEWFHGFPNSRYYKDCFTFKWKEKRVGNRLYAFLCHPRTKSDRSFQLCALCIHAIKTEFETEQSELDRVNQWHHNGGTREAITTHYPEYGEERNRWRN